MARRDVAGVHGRARLGLGRGRHQVGHARLGEPGKRAVDEAAGDLPAVEVHDGVAWCGRCPGSGIIVENRKASPSGATTAMSSTERSRSFWRRSLAAMTSAARIGLSPGAPCRSGGGRPPRGRAPRPPRCGRRRPASAAASRIAGSRCRASFDHELDPPVGTRSPPRRRRAPAGPQPPGRAVPPAASSTRSLLPTRATSSRRVPSARIWPSSMIPIRSQSRSASSM